MQIFLHLSTKKPFIRDGSGIRNDNYTIACFCSLRSSEFLGVI